MGVDYTTITLDEAAKLAHEATTALNGKNGDPSKNANWLRERRLAEIVTSLVDRIDAVSRDSVTVRRIRSREQPVEHEDLNCGCQAGTHPNHRNYLEHAAEREGRVCKLGWPL